MRCWRLREWLPATTLTHPGRRARCSTNRAPSTLAAAAFEATCGVRKFRRPPLLIVKKTGSFRVTGHSLDLSRHPAGRGRTNLSNEEASAGEEEHVKGRNTKAVRFMSSLGRMKSIGSLRKSQGKGLQG